MTHSFNASLHWTDLLSQLGTPPNSNALPTSAGCPLCRKGGLRVYHDPGGGAWFSCDSCRFSGQTFDLARAFWRTTPDETLEKLISLGLTDQHTDDIRHQLRSHQLRQLRFDALRSNWELIRNEPQADVLSPHLFAMCRRPAELHVDWRQREGLWLGGVEVKRLKTLFPSRVLSDIPTSWKHMLVSPLEDLPGRVVGYWCYADEASVSILSTHTSRQKSTTRILGLRELAKSDYKTLVVTADLEIVLREQLASLHESYRPAPLLGVVFDSQTGCAWRQLKQKLVFWGTQLTLRLVREAVSCDAKICVAKTLPRGLSSIASLNALAATAVSWQQAVDTHLATLPAQQACDFVKGLGLSPDSVVALLDTCRKSVRDPILAKLSATPDSVLYGNHTVTVNGPQLLVDGKVVSDAVIRILKIREAASTVYEGTITFRRSVVRFKTKAEKIEAGPESWLRRKLWKRGLGIPFVSAAWRNHLVPIAHLVGNPGYITKLPPSGWNAAQQGVLISDYCLKLGGEVLRMPGDRTGPGSRLCQPLPLSARAVRSLSTASGMASFWSVLANVVANLLEPLTGRSPRSLVLCGRGQQTLVSAAAAACGCAAVGDRTRPEEMEKIRRLSRRNHWPVLFRNNREWHCAASHEDTATEVSGGGLLASFAEPSRGVAAAINYGCDLLIGRDIDATAAPVSEYGQDILPAYLHDLAVRQYELRSNREQPLLRVLDDVLAWWSSLGGESPSAFDIHAGNDVFRASLVELLAWLNNNGLPLREVPRGFSTESANKRWLTVETDAARMYLPTAAVVAELLRKRRRLDMQKLADGLVTSGCLLDESDDVWTLPINVWNDIISRTQKNRPSRRA